ncbi:MAG: hypothetical protein CSB06_02095 [Bacteroidia bacterium]|nr:MAG: hypothetical protein CSB06_02095 [Bacteroidia bacterium]
MIKELETAIEKLYKTFSKYPVKSKISGCPCCVTDIEQNKLHCKKLRELEDEDLSYYAFKAMTTFGDLNDFKHFLPRIFELTARRILTVDTFVILGKLNYGEWKTWSKDEIESINTFLKTWWKNDINKGDFFDVEIMIEVNKLLHDLPSMLNDWNLEYETPGFRNYVELVENYYYDLKTQNQVFKEFTENEIEIFLSWIESNSYRLDTGFFKFAENDIVFSEQISRALYILERMTSHIV